ncbi:YopX family protein [Bacillus mojavensis]|uniref:YopX family protein n=1 Tax=Bacillus mojavensis TaxID=72360 RepID=UPI002DB7FA39|nr:YopX family protein [Bacillus mojavensis]MEC1621118.1 YopX family protein [Bacillus mojavensis]
MREIKFRAWDKKHNHFFKVKEFGNDGSNYWASSKRGGYRHWNPIFVQYTGLKDKNGREIYEGDIVRNHRNNSNELLEVLWQEEVAQRASDGIYWTKEVPGFRFKRIKRGLTTVFVAHVDLEVIGNIYEDPELLETSHASE